VILDHAALLAALLSANAALTSSPPVIVPGAPAPIAAIEPLPAFEPRTSAAGISPAADPSPSSAPGSAAADVSAAPDPARALPLAPLLFGFEPPAGETADTEEPLYFYRGLPYGSESLVGPLRLIVNGGFGILQFDSRSNQLADVDFEQGLHNVGTNLAHPVRAIRRRGWWDFFQREIIPISFNAEVAQYWPNYTLHLIGGGMSYRMMTEWFRLQGYERPNLWATGTIGLYHFLNEVVENDRLDGPNTDAVADLYIFDPLSIALFSSERVNRFFSHTLHMTDWSYQPALDFDHGTIENQGQNFALKWRLPRTERWSAFYFFGTHGHGGLTYTWPDGRALSAAGGLRARELVEIDEDVKSVELVGSYGLFYDRDNSLLASVLWASTSRYKFRLNLYPGFPRLGRFAPGVFVNVNRANSVIAGLDLRLIPGLPVGLAHRPSARR
jgi:hypothetical protein